MKLYSHKDYDEYKQSQVEANKRKIDNSYVDKNSIKYLLDYYTETFKKNPEKVLCHGTRRGLEQQYFKDFLGDDLDIVGTEISDTANDYPYTIEWDWDNDEVDLVMKTVLRTPKFHAKNVPSSNYLDV